jgi:hypothetical protein
MVEGVALADLARRFGTPLYVYSSAAMARALAPTSARWPGRDHLLCYAIKANSTWRCCNGSRGAAAASTSSRAASSSACSPPAATPRDRLLRRRQDARRDAPRARDPASSASTSRAKASSSC